MENVVLSEEYLARKFSRPLRTQKKIIYEITRDQGLLQQYFHLREAMFINVCGGAYSLAKKDVFDDQSEIIVARIGNLCVGGARISFNYPETERVLPMEKHGFRLRNLLPELPIEDVMCAEISRMAFLPEYENSAVMLEISRQLLKRAAERKARFVFTLSSLIRARKQREVATLFGVDWKLRHDLEIPDADAFEGARMVLSMLELAPVNIIRPKYMPASVEEHGILAV